MQNSKTAAARLSSESLKFPSIQDLKIELMFARFNNIQDYIIELQKEVVRRES